MLLGVQCFCGVFGMGIMLGAYDHGVNVLVAEEFIGISIVLDIGIVDCAMRAGFSSFGVFGRWCALKVRDDLEVVGKGIDEGQVEDLCGEAVTNYAQFDWFHSSIEVCCGFLAQYRYQCLGFNPGVRFYFVIYKRLQDQLILFVSASIFSHMTSGSYLARFVMLAGRLFG